MNIRYPLILSAAVVLTACAPERLEKVCTVSVKTESRIELEEKPPTIETKSIVLSINDKTKTLTFNGKTYSGDNLVAVNGLYRGSYQVNAKTDTSNTLERNKVQYSADTGVIDAEEFISSIQYHNNLMTRDRVTINGTCK